ncbi:RodZ domain-containing protein [Microbulbifer sp. Q7]|uniref:RodZ domain-containing protein n=1 Tax=Microbulbifer sp. Q7 TaxID=1785091 RepID=UPI000837795B|nr:RodZ domain-containing protein [Microbulbifer sp. Q7]
MSSNTSTPEQAQTPEAEVEAQAATLGEQLRAAREQAGLTADELARRLCMTADKLEALEQDALERFPGSTYVRGYIRNICKELGADETPVLAAFARQAPAEAPRAAVVPKGPVMGGDAVAGGGSGFGPLLLVVAMAAAGGYWWMGQQGTSAVPAEADLAAAAPSDTTPAGQDFAVAAAPSPDVEMAEDFAPETDAQLADSLGDDAESAGREPEPAEQAQLVQAPQSVEDAVPQPAAVEPVPAPEEVQVSQDAQLVQEVPAAIPAQTSAIALSFSEESWIEVTDAAGNKLLATLQPAGSEVELKGEAPFSLMLGNAAATTVRYAGEVVDSAPLGNRRTRKLTVGG